MSASCTMGTAIKRYQDLSVWQQNLLLAKRVYEWSKAFPADEQFGRVAQMRRAAVSVPSNLAEGHARHTPGEFIPFISHAERSLARLETQTLRALERDLRPAPEAQPVQELIQEAQRTANALHRPLAPRP
jgi:four helix bundle protein